MLKKLGFVFIVLMIFIAAMTVVYAGNDDITGEKLFRRRIPPKRTVLQILNRIRFQKHQPGRNENRNCIW